MACGPPNRASSALVVEEMKEEALPQARSTGMAWPRGLESRPAAGTG